MPRDADSATHGTLTVVEGTGVVRIEQRYDLDPAAIWSALTDPSALSQWYGDVSGEFREGGAIHVRIDGPDIDAEGHIVECAPRSRLRIQTRETDESARRGGGEPFDQSADVSMTSTGDETMLVIEIRGLPRDKLAAYGVGWQIHAETLHHHLARRPAPDVARRWSELTGYYDELAAEL